MATSPTQLTIKAMNDLEYSTWVVEKYVRFNPMRVVERNGRLQPDNAGVRKDMFHFADIVAMREDVGIVAVQCGAEQHHAQHKAKILAEPMAQYWCKCKGRIMLWSWGKHHTVNKDGSKSKRERWMPRREEIKLSMFGKEVLKKKQTAQG